MSRESDTFYQRRAVLVCTPTTRQLFSNCWERVLTAVSQYAEVVADLVVCSPDEVSRVLEEKKPDLVVAAGGDGTINLCVQAMQSGESLAVLPLGTANDLFRELRQQPRGLHRIDCVKINGKSFCTTGGIGIPALVAQCVNRLRQGWGNKFCRTVGRHIYALTAVEFILRGYWLTQAVQINWLDADTGQWRALDANTNMLFVSNQRKFGGSLSIAFEAQNDDGYFEICLIHTKSLLRDIMVMGRIVAAVEQLERDCQVMRVRAARIATTKPVPFFGDGEILDNSHCFELEIAPGALEVLNLDWSLDSITA